MKQTMLLVLVISAGALLAHDNNPPSGGLQKWTYNATTKAWVLASTFNVSTTPIGFRGLAGSAVGNKVTLVASTADSNNDRLVVFVDDGTTVTNTVIATAGTNTVFRGVALSPK